MVFEDIAVRMNYDDIVRFIRYDRFRFGAYWTGEEIGSWLRLLVRE